MSCKPPKDEQMKRVHRQSFMLNTREMRAINHFCEKYKINNRSKFIRETIVTAILKKFNDDYPTLFNPDDNPNLFSGSSARDTVKYRRTGINGREAQVSLSLMDL